MLEARDPQLPSRRALLRGATGALATGAFLAGSILDGFASLRAATDVLQGRGMSCILLWMQGGPSQFETFDPKPDHRHGGPTRAIDTSVAGIQVAEHWPRTAGVMEDICLIRSMTNREGNHQRATYQLLTGYVPSGSVKYPTFGSVVSQEVAPSESELPSYVVLGGSRGHPGAGILGAEHEPFLLRSAEKPPQNIDPGVSTSRFRRRLGLLGELEEPYGRGAGAKSVAERAALYRRAGRMVLSERLQAFELEREPGSVRDEYGKAGFARNCLLARRLVEAGVTFVEVRSRGWDTHANNFDRVKELSAGVDRGFATLLQDLRRRGLLEKTLVVWMGEFGRTPKINPRSGRDHFPRAFSVALAGGGTRGGQVIGATSPDGAEVRSRPVTVPDFFCTVAQGLGIDPRRENDSSMGRPIKIVDGGSAVTEVFGSSV